MSLLNPRFASRTKFTVDFRRNSPSGYLNHCKLLLKRPLSTQPLKSVSGNCSFAPQGLDLFPLYPQLRVGYIFPPLRGSKTVIGKLKSRHAQKSGLKAKTIAGVL